MLTAVAKSKLTEILEDMTTLSAAQLDKLLPEVVALRLEKRKLVLPKRESELLKVINCGLAPAKRRDYVGLQRKLRAEALTDAERVELLKLSDELELLGVARLRAMMELAAIRKTTLPKLMKQLGIEAADYAEAA
jgi:hypothetical protein